MKTVGLIFMEQQPSFDYDAMTAAQLKGIAETLCIDIPPNIKKSELIRLIKETETEVSL